MLDIEATKRKFTSMIDYHSNTITELESINNDELQGYVSNLTSTIHRDIIKPIKQALLITEIIHEVGINNIPAEMLDEWLDNIELVYSLKSLEV